ncbi:hypothetical protein ONZ51_g13436 [Trametes cubensis]|uniref:ribonuclease T2 n=1 Tax=Trametes cubensis TaxID=1111947 RepID=A0AAD7TE63_9APHY|nr:hypothetical protein ONZ51_g13436 [Trametes cubensis]
MRERTNHVLVREHDYDPEYMLFAYTGRASLADAILGHLHGARSEGTAAAQEQLDHPCSYDQYCDLSRQYDRDPSPSVLPDGTRVPPYKGPGVDTFVAEFGRLDLLDYMNKYWISQGSPNADFWGHEFAKHATCTSTFDVACYGPDYKKNQDVVDFFEAVIRAYKMYPTWELLAASGIFPSNRTTYSLSQLQNALKAQTGAVPYLGCGSNGTVLQEVWYFHHVLGSEQFGHFKTLDSTTASTCSRTAGIHYYERTPTSEREVRLLP